MIRHLAALFAAGLMLGGFAACAVPHAVSVRTDAAFPRENLRKTPSLLVVSRDARVTAFKSEFSAVYGRPDSLSAFLARALTDSLNKGTPAVPVRRAAWSAPADSVGLTLIPGPDSAVLETGARYVLRVRDITVANSVRELPIVTTPGVGEGYMRNGGGSSESCVVSFEVEIWDAEGALARRHAFVVTGRSEVFLWAYESALKKAVRYALQGAVAHLRGN